MYMSSAATSFANSFMFSLPCPGLAEVPNPTVVSAVLSRNSLVTLHPARLPGLDILFK